MLWNLKQRSLDFVYFDFDFGHFELGNFGFGCSEVGHFDLGCFEAAYFELCFEMHFAVGRFDLAYFDFESANLDFGELGL